MKKLGLRIVGLTSLVVAALVMAADMPAKAPIIGSSPASDVPNGLLSN